MRREEKDRGELSCILLTIEIYLNRAVKLFGPIKRLDTKIGGCHLAFSAITFVQRRGLNNGSS